MPSENVMPNSYKNYDSVFKIANQIRRTTVLYEELSGEWKLLILNNKDALLDDIKEVQAKDDVFFININDSYGNIKRTSVQISTENMETFANFLKSFFGNDNYLTSNYPNVSHRIKKLFMAPKEEKKENEVIETKQAYRLQPVDFYYYYKSFYPNDVIVEREVQNGEVLSFDLYLVISNEKSLEALEPSFRKAQVPKGDVEKLILDGKQVRLKYNLKSVILDRVKKTILEAEEYMDQLIKIKSPLNKFIFLDVSNYDLTDITLS